MQIRSNYFFSALFLIQTLVLSAQEIISTYNHYGINDGLADNFISDIVKDNFGYVWIAGQNGLTRYDGGNFIVFNKSNQEEFFINNNVSKLYSTGDKIYLLSKEEGLIELDPQKLSFKKITTRGILSMNQKNDTVAHLYADGFLELKKGKAALIKRQLKYNPKDDIVINNNSVFVSSYHSGVYEHKLSNLEQIRVFNEPKKTGYFIYPSKKYGIVLNMSDRLMVFDQNNNLKPYPNVDMREIVTSYSEDFESSQQIIYAFRSVNIPDSLSFYNFIQREIPNVELKQILKINPTTILIASNQGLIKINYNKLNYSKHIDDNSFFKTSTLRVRRKIIEGDKDKFYMLGYPSVVEYDSKSKVFKNLSDIKFPVSYYDGIMVDSVIYVTTEGSGFYSYSLYNNKFVKIPLTELDSTTGLFHISTLNDSTLVIGGFGNIVTYNIKTKTNVNYPIGKKLNVYDIEEVKGNGVFLAATDIGLLNFTTDKSGKIIFSKKTVPTKTAVKDILVDDENRHIWLATNHGVELRKSTDFTKIKEYSKPDEIRHQKVTALQKDKSGRIWATTYSGITVIDYKNNKRYFIDRFDGLRNEEFNYKSFAKLKNGSFIFGGINMYDIVDPEILSNENYINRFYITGIQKTTNGTSKFFSYGDFSSGNISFNTGEEDLYIYISNFDYAEKSGYRFEFKKANYDWIPVVKNRIRLSNDRPGSYKISIRMLNPLGVVVDEKTFYVFAKVPFYLTRLFFILIAIIVCLLSAVSIFLFFRTIKIEKRTKERIADHLHDEAGTTLTKLLMMVNNANSTETASPSVKSGLYDVLYGIRAFIDSMRPSRNNLKDFEDDVKELLNTFKSVEIKAFFFADNKFLKLRQELYRDMKLCIYESITTIVNFSEAQKIELELTLANNHINITVKDDGIREKAIIYQQNGNGLSNFQKRTERHNGSFNILKSEEGEILQFTFDV
jgi:anti-sigma regulatory factor (Ser/Thr protein kinase)